MCFLDLLFCNNSKIVNFFTPRTGVLVLGCGHISHIVKKTLYPSKNLLLYSEVKIRQTEHVVIMNYREGLPILLIS